VLGQKDYYEGRETNPATLGKIQIEPEGYTEPAWSLARMPISFKFWKFSLAHPLPCMHLYPVYALASFAQQFQKS